MVAAHGRHFVVESAEGVRRRCHRRGKKLDCVVGDHVVWHPSGDEGVIEAVEPTHAESQLARALIAARAADIAAEVVLNKVDLPGVDAARERLAPYRRMGVAIHEVSLQHDSAGARAVLEPLLHGHVTLLLGPSGTGKSTLVNLMVPSARAQVCELSAALASGRHTTTTSTWYWLDPQRRGALIDSPGFQEYGLHHLPASRLAALMPDLAPHSAQCRFHNCTHRQEPDCAVRDALARGDIAPVRYRVYEELYAELSAPRY